MSFLEPLFLAGALAIAGPLVFHLIRRSPRGRIRFSSLLFLRESPPRMTRRSRLDDILLLLLRAAALCLIALAFARPFLREAATADPASGATRAAILLDTSASLRRADLWPRALARVEEALDAAAPNDELALFTFDDSVREVVTWGDADPAARRDQIRAALARLQPGWGATDLGAALVAAAGALDATRRTGGAGGSAAMPAVLEIVLVSDVQEGSRLEALDAHDWPEGVRLRVERVAAPGAANAGIALLEDGPSPGAEGRVRVRVSSDPDVATDRFTLAWQGSTGPAGDPVPVQVPPGESRVVALDRPAAAAGAAPDRLVLTGDGAAFDNTLHVAPPTRSEIDIVWIGDDAADDPRGLRYYLERALGSGGRTLRVTALATGEPLAVDPGRPAPLGVVARPIDGPLAASLLEHARRGATLLCVLTDAVAAPSLGALLECDGLRVEEAAAADYAILTDIDARHALLAPFAGSSFGDFSQVRFWRHRRLDLAGAAPCGLRVIARFDGGDPAWVVKETGRGRIVLFLSGWQPRDSQLALSTRFVPLMASLARNPVADSPEGASFAVGNPLPLPPAAAGPRVVRRPDGTDVAVPPGESSYAGADIPGLYTLDVGGAARRVAVNLAPAESRTAALDLDELERRGVRLGAAPRSPSVARQLRDVELERTQGLWKWLVMAALAVLILETALAGARGRRLAAPTQGA